jgi:hypothetical protein
MTPAALLVEARGLGIALALDGEELLCEGPDEALTPELCARLAESKPALIELIRGESEPWQPIPLPWRLTVAGWPIDRRERWGRLANRLADEGHAFPEDERLAFDRISGEEPHERD